MSWDFFLQTHVSMGAVLGIIIVFILIMLWLYQRDSTNHVDIKDLICSNGEIDEKKFTRFGAWIVSTWGFVYLIIDERFSEWFFAGYMAAWVGNALIDKYLTNTKDKNNDVPLSTSLPVAPSSLSKPVI